MTQPEALRLADYMDHPLNDPNDVADAVSSELRRLHAENELLHKRHHDDNAQYTRVLAQRDALLEALRSIADCCDEEHAARDYASRQAEIRGIARAAIKAVEETK